MIPPIKTTSNNNAFYCPHCREITRHIKVGMAERTGNQTSAVRLFARFCDTFRITDIHHTVFGCQGWKCLKCANIHERDSSGKLDDIELDSYMSDGGEGWKEYDTGIYNGRFLNFKRHGLGTYFFKNGDKYIGNWKDDVIHGNGNYIWADGTSHKGVWRDGKLERWIK